MGWKHICVRLHTWLGLLSGGVITLVCLTGALYAFKDEIEAATQPWRRVQLPATAAQTGQDKRPGEAEKHPRLYGQPSEATSEPGLYGQSSEAAGQSGRPQEATSEPGQAKQSLEASPLLPSDILNALEATGLHAEGYHPLALTYGEAADAIRIDLAGPEGAVASVWADPYGGEILKLTRKEAGDFDFFRFILNGHRRLWLPPAIGKPLVGSCVLIFMIVLATGLIVWWPKAWTRDRLRRFFRIERHRGSHRLIFDLHAVLGTYAALVLLLLGATGLVWSFDWYSRGVYRLTGGKELKAYKLPVSDTTALGRLPAAATAFPIDRLYRQLRREEPEATEFYIVIPRRPEDVARASIVHRRRSYYRTDNRFFDRYTLQELTGEGPYAGPYRQASLPDRIRRMNLELHDGRIAGWPGKLAVSLPLTGYLLWWNKRKNKRRAQRGKKG